MDDVIGVFVVVPFISDEWGVDCVVKCKPMQLDVFCWCCDIGAVGVTMDAVVLLGVIVIKLLTEWRWYEWCGFVCWPFILIYCWLFVEPLLPLLLLLLKFGYDDDLL